MRFKLPVIPQKRKWLIVAAGYIIFCLLYTLTGNFHLTTPTQLAPSVIDEITPFLTWTIWVYNSQFFFLAINIYLMRDSHNLSRIFYAMAMVSLFSFCIFTVFPTTLPRDFAMETGLTAKAFQSLYAVDSSANCLPSLHVALAWISAFGVLHERRIFGIVVCLWAAMITLSTMTTKQHYFIDVIAGLILAVLFRILLKRIDVTPFASSKG